MDRTPAPRRAAALLAGSAAAALLGALVPLGPVAAAAPTPAAPTPAAPATAAAAATAAPRLPALPAPVLVGPLEADTVQKDVVLDWQPVDGATVYEVQVGTDENWSDAPSYAATTVSTQLALPTSLPHAAYVWRVAAGRKDGSGRWSAAGSFTRGWTARPQPSTPRPSEDVLTELPEFSWTPVAGASAYEVQVSATPVFDERRGPTTAPTVDGSPTQDQVLPAVDTCFTTHTRVTFFTQHTTSVGEDDPGPCSSTLLGGAEGEPRWWRVRALDRFATDNVPETDTTPASDAGISHLPPRFAPNDADLVSTCPGAPTTAATASPTPTASSSATAAPAEAPAPAGPVGCERTHPVEHGPWSSASRFRLDLPAFAKDTTDRFRTLDLVTVDDVRVGNPCTGERTLAVCSDVPTLRWAAVPDAVSYRVYVSLTASYSNIQRIVDTVGRSFTPTDSWRDSTAGSAYHYAVQACTTAGCGAVTSSPPSFRKTSPSVPLVAPAADALLGIGDVLFRWGSFSQALQDRNTARQAQQTAPTSEAMAYRLQVTHADDPDFRDVPVEDVVVDQTRHASTDVAYADGAYLWRVQALDGSGHRLPWSAPRAFTRDAARPTVSAAPLRLAVDGTLRVTFSEPVVGVSAAGLALAPVRPDGTTDRVARVASRVVVLGEASAVLTPTAPLVAGRTYQLLVEPAVRDLTGNSAVAEGPLAVVPNRMDDRSPALRYTTGWTYRTASNAVGGGFRASTPTRLRQSAVSTSVYGRGVVVTGCVGPTGGLADLWVDGARRTRVDTYRSFSGCGVRLAQWTGAVGEHRVQLRGVGLKRTASRGTSVMVDAVDAVK